MLGGPALQFQERTDFCSLSCHVLTGSATPWIFGLMFLWGDGKLSGPMVMVRWSSGGFGPAVNTPNGVAEATLRTDTASPT